MSTAVLNVRVGQKITYRDAAGVERDAEVVSFPRILLVKTEDGAEQEIRAEQVVADALPKLGRFHSRFSGK
jgi:hypothetical protein